MGWPRTVTVTVGQTDYTSDVLDGVYIQRGRQDFWDGIYATVCNFVLTEPTTVPQIGEPVTVTVALQSGTQTVFGGSVHDVSGRFDPFIGTYQQITCFGPLARAGRRDQTDTLAQQLDGARITALLQAALEDTWEEVPIQLQWDQVDPALDWDDYGIDTSNIDPGEYDVTALTQVPVPTLSTVQQTAFSGQGVVYETSDGQVGYADYNRRILNFQGSPTSIPAGVIVGSSLNATTSRNDIVNQALVEYGSGSVLFTATDSRGDYGLTRRDYTTILADQADAETFAERLVTMQAFPAPQVGGPLTVGLEYTDDTLTDELLGLEINDYIRLTGLPTGITGLDQFDGFLEGVSFDITPFTCDVQLFVSDAKFSIWRARWRDYYPTIAWQDESATLQWQDA